MVNKKPKLAHVITRMIPGGAQEVVTMIVSRLVEEGYEVVFIYGPGDAGFLKQLPVERPNLTKIYIPEFKRRISPYHDLAAFLKLFYHLKKAKVDIVHTHTSKAGILGRWAAFFARVPIKVHHPRGSIYHESYFSKPVLNFFAAVERLTASITDQIIMTSESERSDALSYRIASPEKFRIIYSGVKVSKFLPKPIDVIAKKKEMGIPLDCPVIGYVARIAAEKGHDLCLRAFRQVLSKYPNAMLVLVGEGPLEKEVQLKITEWGLSHRVIMTGLRWDVPEILQTFDCCVQSSIWDALPRAMSEAMLSEKAVVCTQVGGISEIVEDQVTGLLVPPHDAEAMANALIKLLCNPELRQQIGKNARLKIEKVIDFDQSIKKIMMLYDELIERKK